MCGAVHRRERPGLMGTSHSVFLLLDSFSYVENTVHDDTRGGTDPLVSALGPCGA